MNPYGPPPGNPYPHGMPMMPGAVLSAPPMMHAPGGAMPVPAPYVPANWRERLIATPATQPLTLYIGRIPEELPNDFLVKMLEKWNRPEDMSTKKLKGFGFCTFTQGTSALRCRNVMDGLEICGGMIVIKAGTKETTSLATIEASERTFVDASGASQTVDTNATYDAPIREKIFSLIDTFKETGRVSPSLVEQNARAQEDSAFGPDGTVSDFVAGDDEREKQVMVEIEKFRKRQAIRDKEVEARRAEKVAARLRELEEQQRVAAVAAAGTSTQSDREKKEAARREKERDGKAAVTGGSAKRDTSGAALADDDEAKRRRRQQVLAMMSGDGDSATANAMSSEGGLKAGTGKIVIKNVKANTTRRAGGFAGNDEGDEDAKPQRTIVPLDYTEEELQSLHFSSEQQAAAFLQRMGNDQQQQRKQEPAASTTDAEAIKKKKLKELVDSIPANRDQLFDFPVDWEACERHDVVRASMKSWVVKKFVEYLGEEEPALTNFIVTKLARRCHPQELLTEMVPVLDNDAEGFVLKLWRMLIFNIMKATMDASG